MRLVPHSPSPSHSAPGATREQSGSNAIEASSGQPTELFSGLKHEPQLEPAADNITTLALEKVAEEEETVAMEVKVEAQARSEATKVECEALSSHSDDKHHGAHNCWRLLMCHIRHLLHTGPLASTSCGIEASCELYSCQDIPRMISPPDRDHTTHQPCRGRIPMNTGT